MSCLLFFSWASRSKSKLPHWPNSLRPNTCFFSFPRISLCALSSKPPPHEPLAWDHAHTPLFKPNSHQAQAFRPFPHLHITCPPPGCLPRKHHAHAWYAHLNDCPSTPYCSTQPPYCHSMPLPFNAITVPPLIQTCAITWHPCLTSHPRNYSHKARKLSHHSTTCPFWLQKQKRKRMKGGNSR